ncbi:MAG: glycosyltransferase family 61 protein, partial [Alphaproteobacteria bacterium]|nr:glycosyltransferase family 61 protein [Alphaproteobacteria bacterium]
ELLKLFGINRNQLIVVKRPTRFKNVFVPESADNYAYTSKEFNKIFDRFIENANKGKDVKKISKVYVSREKMGDRRTFGEGYISKVFSDNGFHVIYPEKLPLLRQIQIISNCDVLAGCAGTALHLALFMKPGGMVIQLKRNRKNKDNCCAQNHINNIRGLDGIFIDVSQEKYKTDHYTSFPQLVGLTPYLKEFFTDNKFKFNTPETNNSEYCDYIKSVMNYRKLYGNTFVRKLKKFIVKVSACFVPGRVNRANYRNWLKRKLNIR